MKLSFSENLLLQLRLNTQKYYIKTDLDPLRTNKRRTPRHAGIIRLTAKESRIARVTEISLTTLNIMALFP